MARLQQRAFAALLATLFGRGVRILQLDGDYLQIAERGRMSSVALVDVTSPPSVRTGMFGATLTVPVSGRADITLRGAKHSDALAFRDSVETAWIEINLSALDLEADRLSRLCAGVAALSKPNRYPSACQIAPILSDAKALDDALLSRLRPEAIGAEAAGLVALVRRFVVSPRAARADAVATFIETELDQWKDFFDTVESKPLTPEQRLSVVVDEDATLVLAGAGSGKTSVITAKAAYLAKAGIRLPEEILLLAFAKNAAREMSERVEARSGVPVVARTFHALAYEIIGTVEGSKPALANHANDDVAFTNLIKDILKHLVRTRADVSKTIIKWFAHFLVEPKTAWDFKTKHDFYSHMEKQDLRTLQGEKVRSYEELQIANWLYENGIEYEYEPVYEHKVSGAGRREYCPDFRLVESGVYIEHFGVRRHIAADGTEWLTTAPFVNREEYVASMDWKRRVHAECGTALIETYSYERQEGRLLEALAEKVSPYAASSPRPIDEIFDRIVELNQVDSFSQMLGTFLRKFKGGSYSLADCISNSEQLKLGKRGAAFLGVFQLVFEEYQTRLASRIDFEDMILRAALYVEGFRYLSPFRHILVDEFQDISQSRARLVKALKAQHPDTRIFAVGDDWQSIFRFAGSDIHLMRHFGDEFGGSFDGESGVHRIVDLGRTFRSVDQIAFAARDFVLRNPAQIRKQIVPAGIAAEPALKILMTSKNDDHKVLGEVLDSLSSTGTATVLLLGRYRYLEPDLTTLRRRYPKLQISFKTIHASKGLEADHVVLLNADSGRAGFPSEIVDDPLLAMVSPEPETFENAEERRLMYVAMTRARFTLTILASSSRPSAFVTELKAQPTFGRTAPPEAENSERQCTECGGRLLGVRGKDDRIWYRCEHNEHCGYILPACESCETSLPRRTEAKALVSCACGASFVACPQCSAGWLVERSGRYGRFLGCVRYPTCVGKAKVTEVAVSR